MLLLYIYVTIYIVYYMLKNIIILSEYRECPVLINSRQVGYIFNIPFINQCADSGTVRCNAKESTELSRILYFKRLCIISSR